MCSKLREMERKGEMQVGKSSVKDFWLRGNNEKTYNSHNQYMLGDGKRILGQNKQL